MPASSIGGFASSESLFISTSSEPAPKAAYRVFDQQTTSGILKSERDSAVNIKRGNRQRGETGQPQRTPSSWFTARGSRSLSVRHLRISRPLRYAAATPSLFTHFSRWKGRRWPYRFGINNGCCPVRAVLWNLR